MIVGIDFSSYEASLCLLPPDDYVEIRRAVFRPAKDSGAAGEFRAITGAGLAVRLALGARLHDHPETTFVIERGFGSSRRADFTMGAFFGTIVATLAQHYPHARVETMTAARWKRATSAARGVMTKDGKHRGNGGLKKEEAHVHVRAIAAGMGLDTRGWSGDDLDAFAIAWTKETEEDE